jgi:hypothetical protein
MRCALLFLAVAFAPAGTLAEAEAPALAANYRVEAPDAPATHWRFVRTRDCVMVERIGGRVSERWQREHDGRVRYLRAFADRRFVIEYRPVEVASAHVVTNWSRLRSVVDPAELERLESTGETRTVLDRNASIYSGADASDSLEIWWLPHERLPALVRKVDAAGSTRSLTLELIERAQDSNGAACEQDLSGYEWLDFADVGDRHDDPIVHELVAYSESWARR